MESQGSRALGASLAREPRTKFRADRKVLHGHVVADNARIDAESKVIARAYAHFEKLLRKLEQVLSSIADAEAEIALAEVDIA